MDWKATLDEILAERAEQLGDRPTTDDFIALRAGELTEEERQRVLEHAAVDREVAQELFETLAFPEPADEDDREDEAGLGRRWAALRDRMTAEGDLPAVESPEEHRATRWLPLAATFVLGAGVALLVGQVFDPAGPQVDTTPDGGGAVAEARLNLPIVPLLPIDDQAGGPRIGQRGSEAVLVPAAADGVVLSLAVPELVPAEAPGPYRLELSREDGTRSSFEGLEPGVGSVFVLALPREALADGVQELVLRARDGRRVARFELEVELAR